MNFYNNDFSVIGIDEVGRGAIAGPVIACASFLDKNNNPVNEIKDSKKLSKLQREDIVAKLKQNSNNYFGIGMSSVVEIDEMNILNATMLAMERAVLELIVKINRSGLDVPKLIIVDGNKVPSKLPIEAISIIKGDNKHIEIATAAIYAKVFRDNLMSQYNNEFMEYKLHKNVGYGTREHFDAINQFGVTEMHRKSFLTKKVFS